MRTGGRSLTWHLTALILGLVLPALIFIGLLLYEFSFSERRRTEEQAVSSSKQLATALDREVIGVLTTLQALATSPSIRAGDFQSFYNQLLDIYRVQYIHISLRDMNGQTLVATRASFGAKVIAPDVLRETDQMAISTKKAAVSDVFVGFVTNRPAVQIVAPVFGKDGDVIYVLGASLDLDFFGDLTSRENAEGWTRAIIDRNGVVVGRSPEQALYAGRPNSPARRAKAVDAEGFYYGRSLAGVDVLSGYAHSKSTGWTTTANVPASSVTASIYLSLLVLSGIGAALSLIAFLLSAAFKKRVSNAVDELKSVASAISDGKVHDPIQTHVSEMNEVGAVLSQASHRLSDWNATLERRITDAMTERDRAEAQLRQAQKMEAVGRLTGGVAHDFNNLLTVIRGNLETLLRRLDNGGDPRLLRLVRNAVEGANRGAALTSRLLAFSRQSPLAPVSLNCNETVSAMSDLLQRTLAENIALETVLAAGLWRCMVDAPQLESAILNLAVNARDAMPGGGRLTIETANAHIDESYGASLSGEVAAGQYAMLSISDTGVGMTADIIAQAFEPFFTTKPVGKGTGLGLAQVYGFMKQSGGHVAVYSEPAEGTTFRLYFPRLKRDAIAAPRDAEPTETEMSDLRGRGELILVVEDDAMVRDFSASTLEELDYRVMTAEDGATALDLLGKHRDQIALLFTDVVLIGRMNGRDVAEQARVICPKAQILFTSGYTRNAIVHHGRLDEGVELLNKPFTSSALAKRVRQLLDGPPPPL